MTCDYCGMPLPAPEHIQWRFNRAKYERGDINLERGQAIGMYCSRKCLERAAREDWQQQWGELRKS